MNIISKLLSDYPSGVVRPEDFINRLSPGSEGWIFAWASVALAVVFGLLVYIIPIYITEKERQGPYPLWMHTFYCAADFMGIWVFLDLWIKYRFPLFILLSAGEAVWVAMEVFCLERAITYEKDINWPAGTSFKSRLSDIVIQVLCFYVGLNFLRYELHDESMWKFWIFTQVIITAVPALVMERRKSTKGYNLALHIVLICVAAVSFNPWCNMWLAINPDFFGPCANPWYYITGAVCFVLSVRGTVMYCKMKREGR